MKMSRYPSMTMTLTGGIDSATPVPVRKSCLDLKISHSKNFLNITEIENIPRIDI